jgi:hypothetical protein
MRRRPTSILIFLTGFFHHEGSDEHQAYQKFQDTPDENKAELSHELISGAAAYEVSCSLPYHVVPY